MSPFTLKNFTPSGWYAPLNSLFRPCNVTVCEKVWPTATGQNVACDDSISTLDTPENSFSIVFIASTVMPDTSRITSSRTIFA